MFFLKVFDPSKNYHRRLQSELTTVQIVKAKADEFLDPENYDNCKFQIEIVFI